MTSASGEMVTVDIVGSLRRLFFDLAARIVVLIVVILLIASAPLISVAFPAVAALPDSSLNYILADGSRVGVYELGKLRLGLLGYGFGWLAFVCPFCVGVYYMFIATVTRLSREKLEGLKERCPLWWAPLRLVGGAVLSYALVLAPAVAVVSYAESHVAAESALRNALGVENVEYVKIDGVLLTGDKWVSPSPLLYVLYFAGMLLVWSPVLVNLARHFKRYRKPPQKFARPIASPEPARSELHQRQRRKPRQPVLCVGSN
jgi:hypothetical protein